MWALMEGDWSDLTIPEIAEVLGTSIGSIKKSMAYIRKRTGYAVAYTKRLWGHGSRFNLYDRFLMDCLSSGKDE